MQLSRRRMDDLIFLFDADGERFVGGHKLIIAAGLPANTICGAVPTEKYHPSFNYLYLQLLL